MDERRKNSDLEARLMRVEANRSPYLRGYVPKDSVDSKESDDESESNDKRSSDFESVARKFPSKRRDTLLHLKSESKLRGEEGDYLDEI
jgi:hypothetical protein